VKKYKINKNKIDEYPKFRVGYGSNLSVMVPYPENPREGVCDSCGRSIHKGEINVTQLHHFKYSFKGKTVKKDPLKALENLSELCHTCHRLGDSLRELLFLTEEKLWMVVKTALLMPEEMKVKLDKVARSWLHARRGDKKVRLEQYFDDP